MRDSTVTEESVGLPYTEDLSELQHCTNFCFSLPGRVFIECSPMTNAFLKSVFTNLQSKTWHDSISKVSSTAYTERFFVFEEKIHYYSMHLHYSYDKSPLLHHYKCYTTDKALVLTGMFLYEEWEHYLSAEGFELKSVCGKMQTR